MNEDNFDVDALVASAFASANEVVATKKVELLPDGKIPKGRKRCPSCNELVGARLRVCACGNDFSVTPTERIKKAVELQSEELDESVFDYIKGLGLKGKRYLTVYTPSGKCPVELSGYDYESVKEFCEDVVDFGTQQKPAKLYLPSAVKYWLMKASSDKKLQEVIVLFGQWLTNLTTSES